MRNFHVIASVFFLVNFHAFAQIPSDANLRIFVSSLSETNFSGIISNTIGDVQYEIQRKQGKTNWVSMGFILGSETTDWTAFDFRITNAINSKTIRVRSWIDSHGSGMPDWWQLRYFGDVGVDPYGNPEGDSWNNMQKFQNGMDPFAWYPPPSPQLSVKFFGGLDNNHKGSAVLTWQVLQGTIPDYFLIERADRTLRPMTNNPNFRQSPSGARFGAFGTNRPPNFRPMYGRPGWQREDSLVTGPFEFAARIPGQPGVRDYRYVETNVDTFFQANYRIQAHYSPPLYARLTRVDTSAIRETILSVALQPTTNGYALTVKHPIPYSRYLLLVRDKNAPQWRASGYFSSATNRNPIYLHVDKKGMMSDGQSPISMPEVKFLPDVVKPEFTAGWGEDSDGDGLPDIYEVLVTHTEPDNDDTGETGILDGYKKMTGDGLSNFEKFHCRVDPLHPAQPPAMVELKQPTGFEIEKAVTPKSDLHCELQIEVRTNGAANYQSVEQAPWMVGKILNFREPSEPRNFDLRVSWRFSEIEPHRAGSFDVPPQYQAIQSVVTKASLQLFEIFTNNLATNPPLSRNDVTNIVATIERSYRAGEMDKGLIMAEMTLLKNYEPQDFYGKVIDQDGNPLANVHATGDVTLNNGSYGGFNLRKYSTATDSNGLFEFTGLHGAGLGVTIGKPGYENEWRSDPYKNPNGGLSSPTNRTIYRMWSTNIHEALITGTKKFEIVPDGKPHFINLMDGTISDHEGGDLKVWIQYTNHVVQGQLYDWSAGIEVINGGLWEAPRVYNGFVDLGYVPMFTAPENGYVSSFSHKAQIKGGQSGEIGNRFFYLRLNDGKEYGKMGINLFAPYGHPHPGLVCISYAINPSGSRILR